MATLKSSRTSTYEITCIYIYTQLKHASFLSELYTFVNFILYVCASVGCMCASSMYVCVFIGVYAWIKFICICEYVYIHVRVVRAALRPHWAPGL